LFRDALSLALLVCCRFGVGFSLSFGGSFSLLSFDF
jgi:hypothetical protein